MKNYSVSYDLRAPGRDYSKLLEAIKSYPAWCHPLESLWVVRTEKSAAQIRDHLQPFIDRNDGLLVQGLTGEAAWYGLNEQIANWLKAA